MSDVLVIEDQPELAMVIHSALTEQGYLVAAARNGLEGLHQFATSLPRVILLDLSMPVMDGWGFAGALRENYPHNEAKVIVMTALDPLTCNKLEVDVFAWLSKPFNIEELIVVVGRALGENSGLPK